MSNPASSTQEKRFNGVGVSPGIARGTVFVYRPDDDAAPSRSIEESEIPTEIARFEGALLATRAQILEMQQRIAESTGAKDASIFDAHLLVVEDRTLIDGVHRAVEVEVLTRPFTQRPAQYRPDLSLFVVPAAVEPREAESVTRTVPKEIVVVPE